MRLYFPELFLYTLILLILSCRDNIKPTYHVWEKVEIILEAQNKYKNPYTDVIVWVDLEGPEFKKRCYGFWDGENKFVVRILAVSPGEWNWTSGSYPEDEGMNNKSGNFLSVEWSEKEKEENPLRRGMIKPSLNGHAFEYNDGTMYFLLGDTWWPTGTFRFPWYDDSLSRPIGPTAGFKDYVNFRKQQDFNCIAMIAALPNWANDNKPAELENEDGLEIRGAWQQAGTESAKDMHDEEGNRAFLLPGKVPGYENYFPDVDLINPKYFQNLDKKIDYLNASGFIPFIEVARRDIGPAWRKYYNWPESYSRYIQYVWSRYQANICFFSPIHFDWDGSLPAREWNIAANKVIKDYGKPPFGTLVSCNPTGSSLLNFGHTDSARWIGFHQIGNFHHELGHGHKSYSLLSDIFFQEPALPAINGEPYYDGQHDTEPGSDEAALYSRSAMYGSVLSGGLGGHIYGAGKEGEEGGAIWGGNVEEASNYKIWDGIRWESGTQLKHLKTFILSEGKKYQNLLPSANLIIPNKNADVNDWKNWAYCSSTPHRDFILAYFEEGCLSGELVGLSPDVEYQGFWFNPRTGNWGPIEKSLKADKNGRLKLPVFPDNSAISATDWGLKLLMK